MLDAVFKTDEGVFNYRVAGIWIQNKHLLLHKNEYDEHWALPGGRVKMNEKSKAALQREFQEELGVNVQVGNLIWTTENFFNYDSNDFHEIGFYYQISSNDDYEFSSKEFYGTEGDRLLIYKWIPLTRLNEIFLYPGFLKEGIRNLPSIPQHIVIDDKAYLNHRPQQ